jgi:hypothetical protein
VTGAEWFLGAAILITFCIIAGWSVGGRRRERFVAPPPSWWVCPACHSVNNADEDLPLTCYRCGREADPASVERLETSPEFEWTQQLSTTRKGGWDHAVGWAADQADAADEPDGGTPHVTGHNGIATDAPAMPDAQSASDGSS